MLLFLLGRITFSQGAQASGLLSAIKRLDDLYSNLLLTPHLTPLQEAMAATFQSFHISTRLVCVLDIWRRNWSNTTETTVMFSRCRPVGAPTATRDDAVELLRLLQEEVINIPYRVDLYSLFFLLSQFNFCHHWHLWILPTLEQYGARKCLLEGG